MINALQNQKKNLYLRIINPQNKRITKSNTMEILEMTHEQLMNSSMELRNAWDDALYNELYERAKFLFEKGNKHIQLGCRGCIKIKKNEFGIY